MNSNAEPRGLNEVAVETYGQNLSSRFQVRLVEQARSGRFGSLKSFHPELRQSYEKLARLLVHRQLPAFIFGETGTGKRRLVNELHTLQVFLDRLDGLATGTLKVLRADYLQPGFRADLDALYGSGDLVYLEAIETASAKVQQEIYRCLVEDSLSFRFVFGTSVALSLKVAEGSFSRELFSKISEVSVYLPTLIDRNDDLVQLIMETVESMGAEKKLPPAFILDMLAKVDWPKNLDDMETLIRCLVLKKRDPSTWVLQDFPAMFRTLVPAHLFSEDGGVAALASKRKKVAAIHRALLENMGDYHRAASTLEMSKTELLQNMLVLKIR